ncbi:MAG: hypothetical protein Q8O00_04440 [Holophaga sp.]|nr:hypothetical protein [Holophaga sp.]
MIEGLRGLRIWCTVVVLSAALLGGSPAWGDGYDAIPGRVRVLPVAFVPRDQSPPEPVETKLFLQHVDLARRRFREMLHGDTFEIAGEGRLKVVHGRKTLDHYRRARERGAPDMVAELLAEFGLTRFSNPYVFCILVMNARDSFPEGGGRPINGGVNLGGGMMYIASFELKRNAHFQTTLQHELGHGFGLPHVDVYGYPMQETDSIMSYNPAHHGRGLQPSPTPGTLIPEDRRALALNNRVFVNTTFRPARDIPSGGRISPRIVPLGPMTLPGHPDFYPTVWTDGGEYLESRAVNVIQGEIKPSSGPGITYDPGNMWHSKPLPGGKATVEIAFPFPIDADELVIHTQHSGLYHEVSAMKLESLDEAGTPAVLADQQVDSTDEIVTFRPTRNRRWRLTLHTGRTSMIVLRGLEFRRSGKPIVPRLIPHPLEDVPNR